MDKFPAYNRDAIARAVQTAGAKQEADRLTVARIAMEFPVSTAAVKRVLGESNGDETIARLKLRNHVRLGHRG